MGMALGLGLGLSFIGNIEGPGVSGAPNLEGYLTNSNPGSANNTLVAIKPSGVEVGDLLIILVANSDSTNTNQFVNNVAGWNFVLDGGNSTASAHLGLYWREADGTEPATQNVSAQSTDHWTTGYLRVSGADTTTPFVSAESVNSAAAATHSQTWDATLIPNVLLLGFLSFDGGDIGANTTVDQGFTMTDVWWSGDGTQGNRAASALWQKDQLVAGTVGTVTVTPESFDGAVLLAMEIQPPV
ncbi:MAG: hypothetical protein COA96_10360 [SAR86 cluster bacterium]|uniref:Uncharacterized protein n=1 Tax=SAR86 cluster bacterium TaxID=2030880 RepID=A0A2A5AY02_9GAMM|nr:MAG: hypothetical protein COA96_10360 [SAR86 cluster bacterium]